MLLFPSAKISLNSLGLSKISSKTQLIAPPNCAWKNVSTNFIAPDSFTGNPLLKGIISKPFKFSSLIDKIAKTKSEDSKQSLARKSVEALAADVFKDQTRRITTNVVLKCYDNFLVK